MTCESSVIVPPELRALEVMLAEKIGISVGPTMPIWEILGLPEEVAGMTIVDLAAGASPLTHDLLQAGADAYAFDCVYQKSEEELHQLIKVYHQEILKFVNQKEEISEEINRDKEVFWRSLRIERDRYICGWMTELPFPSDFSDLTLSFEGATHVGANNFDLMWLITQEALRITKQGGKVIMSPIYSETHSQLIKRLNFQEGIRSTHELPDRAKRYSEFRRITIIKC